MTTIFLFNEMQRISAIKLVGLGMLTMVGGSIAIASCFAQSPSLDLIEPSVITRGQSAKVRVIGAAAGDCTQALLPTDGFKVIEILQVEDDKDALDLVIDVLASCKLGLHPIRIANSQGISEVRGLTVTPFTTVSEDDARKDLDATKNRTILGSLEGDEIDRYEVQLQSGQWLCADIAAVRLGGKLLDTSIWLLDPDGQKILEVDDTPLTAQDPFFSFQAAKSGRYELAVRAIGADADADSRYALHVGHFPRPVRVSPLGVLANEPWQCDSDASGFSADRFLPGLPFRGNQPVDSVELVAKNDDGTLVPCPTLLPVRVSPEGYQASTNHRDLHTAPFTFETSLPAGSSVHGVRFRVPADGVFEARIYASRVGSSLDSTLEILDDQTGVTIASAEDVDSLDASLVFYGRAEKSYFAKVDDKRSMRGDDYFYRLELGPKTPDITAFVSRRDKRSQLHQSIGVPSGNRVLAMVGLRSDIEHPEVFLDPQSQSKGVEFQMVPFNQNKRIRPLILSAGPQAPLGWEKAQLVPVVSGPSKLDASSGTTIRGEFLQVLDLIRGPADTLFFGMRLDHFMVGVLDPIPFQVDLLEIKAPLTVDGTLKIDGVVLRDKRADGSVFDGAIDVFLSHLPEGVTAPPQIRVPRGSNNFSIELKAELHTPLDQWPLVVEAAVAQTSSSEKEPQIGAVDAAMSSGTLASSLVCSSLRNLVIDKNPANGQLDPIALEAGDSREVVCQVALETPFDGPFQARIEGLPNRIESAPVQTKEADRPLRFQIAAPKDAPLGRFDSIYVRLTGQRNGQDVSYCICRGTVLVVTPKGQLVTDDKGRPISPLDALRKKSQSIR